MVHVLSCAGNTGSFAVPGNLNYQKVFGNASDTGGDASSNKHLKDGSSTSNATSTISRVSHSHITWWLLVESELPCMGSKNDYSRAGILHLVKCGSSKNDRLVSMYDSWTPL